jgi:hypothetical protein
MWVITQGKNLEGKKTSENEETGWFIKSCGENRPPHGKTYLAVARGIVDC